MTGKGILAHKLRSALTMLGIVMGVLVVIVLVSRAMGSPRRWRGRLRP